jgi:hypothetical protein
VLQQHLQCGTIRFKCDDVWFFEVNNLKSILENVIPFLSAKKQHDFAIFKRMASLMAKGAHLGKEGIMELLELRREMNDGGKRKYDEQAILAAFDGPESSETIRQTLEAELPGII